MELEETAQERVEESPPLENVAAEEPAADEGQSACASCEALLFASAEPLSLEQICLAASLSEDAALNALSQIEQSCLEPGRGLCLFRVAGKYQLRTKPLFAAMLRELKADRPRRLSGPALETLAVVAYRQPIVKSDIEKIRGVDVAPTLKTLLERSLVKIVGHKPTVGQPALYGTTEEFLKVFGLDSLAQLPTLRDLNELQA